MNRFAMMAALALVLAGGGLFGQAADGGNAVQKALSAVAGMRSDLGIVQAENKRLNARLEELEAANAALARRLDELQKLCVSLNEQLLNQEKAAAEQMRTMQAALEADRRSRQQEMKQLGQDLGKLLKTPPPKPQKPAYSGKVFDYTVASGDTLSSIAKAAGVPMRDIMDLNGLKSADVLRVGQVLQIPDQKK